MKYSRQTLATGEGFNFLSFVIMRARFALLLSLLPQREGKLKTRENYIFRKAENRKRATGASGAVNV